MSTFIGNMIARHTYTLNNVAPRLPGKFELADSFYSGQSHSDKFNGQNEEATASNTLSNSSSLNANTGNLKGGINDFAGSKDQNLAPQPPNHFPEKDTFSNSIGAYTTNNTQPSPLNSTEEKKASHYDQRHMGTDHPEKEHLPGKEEPEGQIAKPSGIISETKIVTRPNTALPVSNASPHLNFESPHLPIAALDKTEPTILKIKVSIGKVEIKVSRHAAVPDATSKESKGNKLKLSLDDYLKTRNGNS